MLIGLALPTKNNYHVVFSLLLNYQKVTYHGDDQWGGILCNQVPINPTNIFFPML